MGTTGIGWFEVMLMLAPVVLMAPVVVFAERRWARLDAERERAKKRSENPDER